MRLPPLKNGNHLPPEEGSDPNVPVTKRDMCRGLLWSDVKSAAIAAVAVVSGIYAALHALDARGQQQVDAGVAVVKAANEERFRAIEAQIAEVKQDTKATQATIFDVAIKLGVKPTLPPQDAGK